MKEVLSLFLGLLERALFVVVEHTGLTVEPLRLENFSFSLLNIGLVMAASCHSFQKKHDLKNNAFSWMLFS